MLQHRYSIGIFMRCHLLLVAVIPEFELSVSATTPEGAALPHFKWGQTREKLFVTIALRSLDRSSVKVTFGDDKLVFHALDATANEFALDLELAQDVEPTESHWEHLQRPDRWGDAVLASLPKKFPGRWDTLVADSRPYRKVMDRDWAREDQQLEPPEEDVYFKEHQKYANVLTPADVEKARKGVEALIVNVRHKECDQCKVVDETFAKIASNFSKTKRKAAWQTRIRFAIVDPRSERTLARSLGSFCSQSPVNCKHYALAYGGGDVPVKIRGRHDEGLLMADLQRLAREQFRPINVEDAQAGRDNASRALIVLGKEASTEYRSIAHRLRLQADVALANGPEFLGLPLTGLAIWTPGEIKPDFYHESFETLESWLRARVIVPLAKTSEFDEDEPYEELGLPIVRLFLNGTAADASARAAVQRLAREFVGRVAFVARNATSKAHEWRQHGLPPGRFPSLAAAESMMHNATKYAFLDMPRKAQINESNPNATADAIDIAFWNGPAKSIISTFLEDVLAHRLGPSYPSEDPPEEEFPLGTVKKLVGRECTAIVDSSDGEVLIEAFDEWRRDHPNRTMHLDVLSPLLARWNISTYRLDLGYNECPPSMLPIIPAGYSGYFFVPRHAKARGNRPDRLKKLDPSFAAVLKYVGKHSQSNFSKFIPDVRQELEAIVAQRLRYARLQEWWDTLVSGGYRKYCVATLVGLASLFAFLKWR